MNSFWKLALSCLLLTAATACSAGELKEETRKLELDGKELHSLHIENGDGTVHVIGEPGRTTIDATADLAYSRVPESKLRLSLEATGDTAVLNAYFANHFSIGATRSSIDLTVRVPEGLKLSVDDGDEAITVENLREDVKIADGDGNITLKRVEGAVTIDDGDGDIVMKDITGPVKLSDGDGSISLSGTSGSLELEDGDGAVDISGHQGSVTFDEDGDGDIEISDVTGDVLVRDGDGEIRLDRIGGSVDLADGDGGIAIDRVDENVTIRSAGDGNVTVERVKGTISRP